MALQENIKHGIFYVLTTCALVMDVTLMHQYTAMRSTVIANQRSHSGGTVTMMLSAL